MKTFAEIETAAKNLPPLVREKLARSLSSKSPEERKNDQRASSLRVGADCLLVAPAGAPAMTPERVKHLLEESP